MYVYAYGVSLLLISPPLHPQLSKQIVNSTEFSSSKFPPAVTTAQPQRRISDGSTLLPFPTPFPHYLPD